jgi:hypothetical protein
MQLKQLVAALAALFLVACGQNEDTPGTSVTDEAVASTAVQAAATTPAPLATATTAIAAVSAEQAGVIREDDWVVGPADAAVTLIEYGDFQ